MNAKLLPVALSLTALVAAALPPPADAAASIRVRCETRIAPARSKISVDGRDVLPNAMYSARVISGSASKTSPPRSADFDEVEFDFDSNPGDIRRGATAIPATFIKNNSVRAVLLNASGQVVAGPTTAVCEID